MDQLYDPQGPPPPTWVLDSLHRSWGLLPDVFVFVVLFGSIIFAHWLAAEGRRSALARLRLSSALLTVAPGALGWALWSSDILTLAGMAGSLCIGSSFALRSAPGSRCGVSESEDNECAA
jgi:hypothetical protein